MNLILLELRHREINFIQSLDRCLVRCLDRCLIVAYTSQAKSIRPPALVLISIISSHISYIFHTY